MGSGQSLRKITIENEEEGNIIDLSNSLLQRVAQGVNEPKAEKAPEVRFVTPIQTSPKKVVSSELPENGKIPSSGHPETYNSLTLSALEMQLRKDKELRDQDQYWQDRLQKLERGHKSVNNILEEEEKKAMEQLYANGQKNVNIEDHVQPCMENSTKVFKCYQEHPKNILLCSNLVEEFSNCVDQRRARVISARC